MQDTLTDTRPPLNDSLFHMWRCLIAVIMSDGVYHPAERKFLDNAIAALERAFVVQHEQKMAFFDDLKNPKNVDELLAHVSDPLHRALLPYFGQYITMIDGRKDPKERTFVHHLQAKVSDPAASALSADIDAAISAGRAQNNLRFKLVDFLLDRLGIGPLE